MGSSQSRDQTHGPCIGRRILNHWTIREVPLRPLLSTLLGPISWIHGTGTIPPRVALLCHAGFSELRYRNVMGPHVSHSADPSGGPVSRHFGRSACFIQETWSRVHCCAHTDQRPSISHQPGPVLTALTGRAHPDTMPH